MGDMTASRGSQCCVLSLFDLIVSYVDLWPLGHSNGFISMVSRLPLSQVQDIDGMPVWNEKAGTLL